MIRPTSYWRNDKWRNGCETRTGLKKSILIIPCPLQNLKCIHSHLISSRYCLGKWKDSKNSVSTKTTCTATYSRTLPFWSIPSDMTSRTSLKLSITLWHSASDAAAITALLWLNVSPWAIPSDCYSAGESDFWRERWSSTPWHRTCFQVLHIQHHSKQPWYEFQPADESSTVLQPLFIVKQLLFTSAIQTKITLSTSQCFLPFSLFLGSSTAPQNLTPNLLVVLTTHCIMCLYLALHQPSVLQRFLRFLLTPPTWETSALGRDFGLVSLRKRISKGKKKKNNNKHTPSNQPPYSLGRQTFRGASCTSALFPSRLGCKTSSTASASAGVAQLHAHQRSPSEASMEFLQSHTRLQSTSVPCPALTGCWLLTTRLRVPQCPLLQRFPCSRSASRSGWLATFSGF